MKSSIILITPSLRTGGAERVISILANYAAEHLSNVVLIILTKQERFYPIDSRVKIIEPKYGVNKTGKLLFIVKNFMWLRLMLKRSSIQQVLSFSGKYNAYVLLASIGLGKKVFISDRSKPAISYGKFLDFLNPIVYKWSEGIIAQTSQAKMFSFRQTKHKNIEVIPNPVKTFDLVHDNNRKSQVINVGRFIKTKHQDLLVKIFDELGIDNWDLVFFGDGPMHSIVKEKALRSRHNNRIFFNGNVKEVGIHYVESAIFAFTSSSEGFPNALAEAMASGCACISFNCVAGPQDLIDDGINGYLINEGDVDHFKKKLLMLMEDEKLRKKFGMAAREKMKNFEQERIAQKYLDFIVS
ncbi:MAG: glycosyltransferase [Salibacteraceae bacterium]